MGQDFILSRTEVTFGVGSESGNGINIIVDILDDLLVEGTENFTLTGSVAPPASFVGGPVTVSIIDNDGKWVCSKNSICDIITYIYKVNKKTLKM